MAERILVTGASGQIGSELVPALQKKHGMQNVFATSRHKPGAWVGNFREIDVMDFQAMEKLIHEEKITQVFHLVSILSANGEKDPETTWQVNVGSLKFVLDMAVKYKLRLFWPSSIAVFGPTTPKQHTPQHTILEPSTMYGITKLAGESLCFYYNRKFGVDVRSLRYPGLISWKTPPGGGTTDYAVAVFYDALQKGHYNFFVREDTVLPMMYMDDAIKASLVLMDAKPDKIKIRHSYNLGALSFSAGQLALEVKSHIPRFTYAFNPDERQKIADSWPQSIDDSEARKDWGWKHAYSLQAMSLEMLKNLKAKFGMK